MISLIVAVSENNVIGADNDLPWRLRDDLRRFKELTVGQTVVMGRKTYDSIVARLGHALPDRRNIVLTRQDVTLPGAEVIHDSADIAEFNNVIVIGGAMVYDLALPMADRLYVTEVKTTVEGDTYFPAILPEKWREISRESHKQDERNDHDFDFVIYERL
jgi:dihydrofolate reductase